jgi:hypothetical protein
VSSNEIGATVLIDGQPISDGCTSTDPHAPAVLSGLRVTWGRTGTVDQPTPSSCVFTVADPTTGPRLVPTLTIGRRVDVRTDTVIYPDPTVSTIPALIPSDLVHATRVVVAPAGTATAVADGTGLAMLVTFPPLAYTPNPLGWDTVPRTLPGQSWRFTATAAFPAVFAGWHGWAVTVCPVAFTRPDGTDARPLGPAAPGPAVDVTFTPPPGVWLGLQVRCYPPGPAWAQLDGTAWSGLPGHTWEQLSTIVISGVQLLAPAAGAAQSALVFSGRITDVIASWDGGPDTGLQVIAQDWLAELANRFVGDTPWPAEPLGTRADRVVALSGQPVTLTTDPGVAALQVTYRDVDRQAATGLLQQLATSCGGILWTATHLVTGQVMRIEDTAARPAALTLSTAGTGLVHVVPSPAAIATALPLTACDLDADPVRFVLDMTDTVSMVAVQWLEQVADPGPPATVKPTQRTLELTDPNTLAVIGARRLSVSTQLTGSGDATLQAQGWLARSSVLAWRIEGLTWDTDADLDPGEITAIMTLLDGTRRNGLPIALTDLPDWAEALTGGQDQVALYVEGGTYTYAAGSWVLELATSAATGSAAGNTPWTALDPGWRWLDFDPAVTWLDLYGVTYPPA